MSIQAPALPAALGEAWARIFELARRESEGWTIVGGQMVHLHAWERGYRSLRATSDIDAGLGLRARPALGVAATAALRDMGMHPEETSTDGPSVRWRLGDAVVDVLIPYGMGRERRDINDGRLLESHGVQQALDRTSRVDLRLHEGQTGKVPRPSLYAAVIGKAAALSNSGDGGPRRERHLDDLDVLLTLLTKDDMRTESVTPRDQHHLEVALDAIAKSPERITPGVRAGLEAIETRRAESSTAGGPSS